ncbi:hypothetical protein RhiJN_07920 [Ceratobasidium sp. AG-Ba]|nr:hypothetical protein RhiJN_07920 [Ceratobasidium sp. AG-Ba]
MSRQKSLLPDSDLSELEDSPFHNSKGPKSDAARLREMRKRVARGGLEEVAGICHLSTQRLLPSRPKKRARIQSNSRLNETYQGIDAARQLLEQHNLTVAKLVQTMCAYDYAEQRTKEQVDFQLSRAEAEDAQNVRSWAKEIARQELLREGKQMEKYHFLNTNNNSFTLESLKDWSPNVVFAHLSEHMPYFVSLLEAFIKDGEHSSEKKEDEVPTTISFVGSMLWLKRSQRANLLAKGLTAYLYSSGVHAATINVLNRVGLGVSYKTLLGSISSLNRSCTKRFQETVSHCRSLFCWDNINFQQEPAEQRLKSPGLFESGTTATVIELHPPPGCDIEDIDKALDLDQYLASVNNAPDLKIEDVMPTLEDEKALRNEFIFETINILTDYAGDLFKKFKKINQTLRPLIRPLLPLRVSKVYPLPTLHIEQASANGNATIIEELQRITQIEKSELFKQRVLLATGDLLTVMRLLSVRDVRTLYMRTPVHIKDIHENLSYLVPFASLFHIRMTGAAAILHTHFGKPNVRPEDGPASLWRHNEVLKRKNIPINQAFKYRTVQDLVFHSLSARLLDIVRIESGHESLTRFGEHLAELSDDEAWAELRRVVSNAVNCFTTPEEADTDDMLRNSMLFIRDALLFRCFITSIKCGNTAMIELILKSNMLVNMTGNQNGWKETDLLQEHMNYWIKIIYKARGSNASWKWLSEISPCITVLRELATQVNTTLAPRNSNHHTTPNLQADLEALTKSLEESKVHEYNPARCLAKTLRARDVLAAGLHSLQSYNSPIDKFNKYRFGAQNPNPNEPEGMGDEDERNENTSNSQESQNEIQFNVVVDNGDGEDMDPFDFD